MGLVSGMGCKADGGTRSRVRAGAAPCSAAWFPAWGGFYSKRKGQGGEGEKWLTGYNWNGQKDLWNGRFSAKFEEQM